MTTAILNLDLQRIIRTVPGYDPFRAAPGCWFDEQAADLAVQFFPECLRHIEGAVAGQPFVLEPWQQAIVANLFGWRKRDEKGRTVRRYREAFIYVPRKNGKTPLAAGICCYVLFCDGEAGAQIYSAAADREQAALLFRQAAGMVSQEPELERRAQIYGGFGHRSIVLREDPASVYRVISADAHTKHGLNSHLVIVDELHAQPGRELIDVLQTSLASSNRRQPLMISITTADFMRESICNEKYDYACKIRDGVIDDASFLPVIYEATNEEDWTSPEVWRRCNPNLGISVSEDYLTRECGRAQELPAYQNTFKRLHLNMRTEQDVRWIPMDLWDSCDGRPFSIEDLLGRPCWGGLDLASTTDVAALALVFRDGEQYLPLMRFWVPAEGAERRSRIDRVPYTAWIRDGWIAATPGPVIDYDRIHAEIARLSGLVEIREIACDRWNATQLIQQVVGDGITAFAHGQGFKDMTAPAKEFSAAVAARRIRHGGNPVLRWMVSNASAEMDAAGNLKPSKAKSTERIDGVVAMVMGIGRAMLADGPGSVYDDPDRGFITI